MNTTVVIAPQDTDKIKYLQQESLNSILINKNKCVIFTLGGINTVKQLVLLLQNICVGVKEIKITSMLLKCASEEIEENKIYNELVFSTKEFIESEDMLLVVDLPYFKSADLEKCTFIINNLLDETLNGEITIIIDDGDIEIEACHDIADLSQIFKSSQQFSRIYNLSLKDYLSGNTFSSKFEFSIN